MQEMTKRQRIRALKAGQVFQVVLEGQPIGRVVVARRGSDLYTLLGYFFAPEGPLSPDHTILVGRFSGLDIFEGLWPELEPLNDYSVDDWPVPLGTMDDAFRDNLMWIVRYDPVTLEELERNAVQSSTFKAPTLTMSAGLSGSQAAALKLRSQLVMMQIKPAVTNLLNARDELKAIDSFSGHSSDTPAAPKNVDSLPLYSYDAPAPAPSKSALHQLLIQSDGALGDYINFLKLHDGWPNFFLSSHLLSCKEIMDNVAAEIVDPVIEVGIAKWLESSITIGASFESNDLFSISPQHDGAIVWSAYGEIVEVFPSPADFFNGLARELRDEAEYLSTHAQE